jgi:pimeloyl-ACP methyl ester carboxylesterase
MFELVLFDGGVPSADGLAVMCSIGGYTVLSVAAAYPDQVSGLVLMNAAGQFESSDQKLGEETPEKDVVEMEESLLKRLFFTPIKDTVQKYTILFAFWQAKQPARIESVLRNVSPPTFFTLKCTVIN